MAEYIINFLLQLGIGSIIGVIIGMIFQYFIGKKLKVYETKLVIFRRVYKQLYYFVMLCEKKLWPPEDTRINATEVAEKSGLDLKKDLGDILYYVDGDMEIRIANLIYSLHEDGVINRSDLDEIRKIMRDLRKIRE